MKLSTSNKLLVGLGLIIVITDVISSLLFGVGFYVADDPTKYLPRWIGIGGLLAWVVTYGFFAWVWCKDVAWLTCAFFKGDLLFTCTVLLIFFGIIFLRLTDPSAYSGETPQEVACTLKWMSLSSDFGFRDTCLFEYPLRQFYLHVIPTLILGRSQLALNLGGTFWLLLGLPIFAVGALKFFGAKTKIFSPWSDALCATHIAALFHVYYVNHFALQYEQSIFPISMCFLAVGLTYHYLTDKELKWLLGIGLIGLHAIYSYTPGLAVVGLMLTGLVTVSKSIIPNREHRQWCYILAIFLIIEIACSFTVRGDVRIFGRDTSQQFFQENIEKALQHIFFQNQGMEYVSKFLNPLFLGIIYIGLTFQLGWRFAVVSAWAIACLISAVLMQGYAYYGIDFRFHKALVIFPPLLAMSMHGLFELGVDQKKTQRILSFILLPLVAFGLGFQNKYLQTTHPSRVLALALWTQARIPPQPTRLFFHHDLVDPYFTFGDARQYYIPHVETFFLDDGCPINNFTNPDNPRTFYALIPDQPIIQICPAFQLLNFERIDSFAFEGDKNIALYRIRR